MTRTSFEWFEKYNREQGLVILDPDGWDRNNWDYSWREERITEQEFQRRLINSTIKCNFSKMGI